MKTLMSTLLVVAGVVLGFGCIGASPDLAEEEDGPTAAEAQALVCRQVCKTECHAGRCHRVCRTVCH